MTKKTYSALDYALRYLAAVPKSESDVLTKMMQRWYTEREISSAMAKLKELWVVNDENFVKLYIDSEVIKKWKPVFVAKGNLFKKWIPKHLVETYCTENWDEIRAWMFMRIEVEIEKYKAKWLVGVEIIQKLQSKGYNFGHIQETVNRRGRE